MHTDRLISLSHSAMDLPNQQTLRTIAAASQSTVERYLDNPSDRAARLKALRDAKNLVSELQNGDDAFFDRLAQVRYRRPEPTDLVPNWRVRPTDGFRFTRPRLCDSSWPLAPLRRSHGKAVSRLRSWRWRLGLRGH